MGRVPIHFSNEEMFALVYISVVSELVQKNVVRRSVHSEYERELNEPLFQRLILELNLVHLGRKKRERSLF